MDSLRNRASDMMGSGGIGEQLKDINFPASKDEVLRQLEQKGVPGPVIDKVRNADTSQFNSVDDLRSKVGL